MEISNSEEYKLIRDEMQNLKNCITTYLGFVLGGSGLALLGFYTIENYETKFETIAFISLILAITVSLVLYIIFYKFNSHNRYAGYCKLLNQEQLFIHKENPELEKTDFNSWEICIDRLRLSDFEFSPFQDLLPTLVKDGLITNDQEQKIIDISGTRKESDKHKFRRGLRIIFRIFIGNTQTKSWQFPLFVVGVFLSLSAIHITFSLYSMYKTYPFFNDQFIFEDTYFNLIVYFILFVIFINIWIAYVGKLYNLMCGSATINAYCWKFLPSRYAFIKSKSQDIGYSLITLKDNINKNNLKIKSWC